VKVPLPLWSVAASAATTIATSMGVWLIFGERHAMSFALGGGLMTLNWAALFFALGRLLQKKSIALALSLIVIKWSIFAAFCIYLARHSWVEPFSLMGGICTVVVTSLLIIQRSQGELKMTETD
jgi:hypothetical protein